MGTKVAFIVLLSMGLYCQEAFTGIVGSNLPDVVVTTTGIVRGIRKNDLSTHYYNIPYAFTDDIHRFQEPQPVPSWSGMFNAYDQNICCIQRFPKINYVIGAVDCLTLNVYVPDRKNEELLPVIIFIHGGGYKEGSNSPILYGPQYLINKGVLLVVINYRLWSLGFVCLGLKEAPGNAGMKDQVAAMRWVQRNIRAFGGDPDQVTIMGESAGSASVSYHLISPMSAGLFKGAILESGSAVSPWTFQRDPIDTSSKLAAVMGFNSTDPRELYKFFMSKTAKELAYARIPRPFGDQVYAENFFCPCVEREIPGIEVFLTGDPYTLYNSGKYNKVPVIQGFNNHEGYRYVGKENDTTIDELNFLDALPHDLHFDNSSHDNENCAQELQTIYFDGKPVTKENIILLSDYEGDVAIIYPTITNIKLMIDNGDAPVYAFKFCYDGNLNIVKKMYGYSKYPGATHGDELFYIFNPEVPLYASSEDKKMIDRMTTMWTNFAKYSNPTPIITPELPVKWIPANICKQVLVIDTNFSYEDMLSTEGLQYLQDTYEKYRKTTYVPFD